MKTLRGKIIRVNNDEHTVKVQVITKKKHPVYLKYIPSTKNYLVHSDKKLEVGQEVVIVEVKPISKMKKFKVLEK